MSIYLLDAFKLHNTIIKYNSLWLDAYLMNHYFNLKHSILDGNIYWHQITATFNGLVFHTTMYDNTIP